MVSSEFPRSLNLAQVILPSLRQQATRERYRLQYFLKQEINIELNLQELVVPDLTLNLIFRYLTFEVLFATVFDSITWTSFSWDSSAEDEYV